MPLYAAMPVAALDKAYSLSTRVRGRLRTADAPVAALGLRGLDGARAAVRRGARPRAGRSPGSTTPMATRAGRHWHWRSRPRHRPRSSTTSPKGRVNLCSSPGSRRCAVLDAERGRDWRAALALRRRRAREARADRASRGVPRVGDVPACSVAWPSRWWHSGLSRSGGAWRRWRRRDSRRSPTTIATSGASFSGRGERASGVGRSQLFAPNFSLRGTLARVSSSTASRSRRFRRWRTAKVRCSWRSPRASSTRRARSADSLPWPRRALALPSKGGRSVWRGRVTAARFVALAAALASPSFRQHHFVVLAVAGAGLWRVLAAASPRRRVLAWAAAVTPLVATITLPTPWRSSPQVPRANGTAVSASMVSPTGVVVFFLVAAVATTSSVARTRRPFARSS